MEEYVGEEYDAVVSSIVKFGLFVELPNTVEGLIHITNLPEFYHFNERDLTLRGGEIRYYLPSGTTDTYSCRKSG